MYQQYQQPYQQQPQYQQPYYQPQYQQPYYKPQHFKGYATVLTFAIIGLVLKSINAIASVVSYFNIFDLLFTLITLTPFILIMVYVPKLHDASKGAILVPLSFILLGSSPILSMIYNILFTGYVYWLNLVWCSLLGAAFTLAAIGAFTGFSKKPLIVTGMSLLIGAESFILIIDLITMIQYYEFLYIISVFAGLLSYIFFGITMLIFGINNTIPAYCKAPVGMYHGYASSYAIPSKEAQLRALDEQFRLGMISPDQYAAQRMYILSNQ